MPNIVGIQWDADSGSRGQDIHLLTGQGSPPLNGMLVLLLDNGSAIFASQASGAQRPTNLTSISFQAGCINNQATTGVSVNPATGQVTASGSLPNLRVHNFLVHAEVRLSDARVLRHKLHVHVHRTVSYLWLTPASLHVPQGSSSYGFTVMAEFDDGVVGDVTYSPGLTWYRNNTACTSVLDTSSPATATIEVRYGGIRANATAIVGPAWSARTVEYLGGAGKKGAFQDGKTNILFIPEGFTDAERGKFRAYVLDLVRQLRDDPFTRPFDLLRDSIRYWLAWAPSTEQGIGVLPEVTLRGMDGSGKCRSETIPQPQAPGAAAWTLEQLIHEVGLPVPADTSKNSATKIGEWGTLFGAKNYANVTPALFTSWLAIADRRLVDERDTAFGLALGERPRAEQCHPPRALTMHPRRASPAVLRQFLSTLTYGSPGQVVGTTWTDGADKGLVCLICRSEQHGGAQSPTSPPYFTTTVDEQQYVRLQTAQNPKQVHILPVPLRQRAKRITVITVAHECAHGLGLLDEYGNGQGTEYPASQLKSLQQIGNLQGRPETGSLVVDNWLWPRIAGAGVLKEEPDVGPSIVTVTLMAGHARPFKTGSVVLLRRRHLPWGLKEHLHTGPLQTESLTITEIDGDVVTLRRGGGDVKHFAAGDLLIQPVLHTDGKPLTLVAPNIIAHINRGQPLWAYPPPPSPPVAPISVTPPTNLPGGRLFWVGRKYGGDEKKKMPRMRARLVGLYEGGGTYDRGVYRPAGICLMRGLWEGYFGLYPFCPVCRYFIVDRIDPTKHKELDKEYAKEYPEP